MKCFYPKNIPNPVHNNTPNFAFKRLIVPCGECIACLHTKRQIWSYRLYYELKRNIRSYFITLTYSDDNLPQSGVQKDAYIRFTKRLRKVLPYHVRYFACAEYGSRTNRPHYHAIIFLSKPLNVSTLHNINYKNFDDAVKSCWKLGFCHIGKVTPASINYVTKYLITKSTFPDNQNKPFILMSRKPMLGYDYVQNLSKWHSSNVTRNYMPGPHGEKIPLHRGFREHLKKHFDIDIKVEYQYSDKVLTPEQLMYNEHCKVVYSKKQLQKITKNETI